jgi:hypothetical protein
LDGLRTPRTLPEVSANAFRPQQYNAWSLETPHTWLKPGESDVNEISPLTCFGNVRFKVSPSPIINDKPQQLARPSDESEHVADPPANTCEAV